MSSDLSVPELGSDRVPRRRGDLLVRHLGGGSIVWSPLRDHPMPLDPVATVLLDVIDGEASVADLVEDVHAALGVDRRTARARIVQAIDAFEAAGALESSFLVQWADVDPHSLLPPPDR